MTLSHQGFDRQLSAMLRRRAVASRRRRQDFWRRAGGTQSQGIQNSQQLTGGYFHDNGPSPHCSQSAKNLSCELLGHPKHSL